MMMPQMLEINKIAVIFLDPITERMIEAEAILIERINSTHLYEDLFWENWKVKFLDEEESEICERFILAQYKPGKVKETQIFKEKWYMRIFHFCKFEIPENYKCNSYLKESPYFKNNLAPIMDYMLVLHPSIKQ